MRQVFIKATNILFLLLIWNVSYSQQCNSFGWVNYDGQNLAGAVMGGGNTTPLQVTTFAQLKSAADVNLRAHL